MYLKVVQENQSWTEVKAEKRDFLFQKITAIGEESPQHRTGFNSEHNPNKQGFTAKEQDGGGGRWMLWMDGQLLGAETKDEADSS